MLVSMKSGVSVLEIAVKLNLYAAISNQKELVSFINLVSSWKGNGCALNIQINLSKFEEWSLSCRTLYVIFQE